MAVSDFEAASQVRDMEDELGSAILEAQTRARAAKQQPVEENTVPNS